MSITKRQNRLELENYTLTSRFSSSQFVPFKSKETVFESELFIHNYFLVFSAFHFSFYIRSGPRVCVSV